MVRNIDSFKKDKEGAIFKATLKIIKEKGFHKARMSDIAKETGISYGLVYHYFKNKEDLFEAILNSLHHENTKERKRENSIFFRAFKI